MEGGRELEREREERRETQGQGLRKGEGGSVCV